MNFLIIFFLIELIQLNHVLTATTKRATTTTSTTTSNPGTTDIIYDYSMLNDTAPIIVPSDNKFSSSSTTPPIPISPEAQLNETINNIELYIPELQNEVSNTPRVNFEKCTNSICNDVCTHVKLDLLAMDTYSNINIKFNFLKIILLLLLLTKYVLL